MIRKLQQKFIIVSMCSVAAVLTVVMLAACVLSYMNLNREFDQKLSMLAENDGRFPTGIFEGRPGSLEGKPGEADGAGNLFGGSKAKWPQMSAESPYETRFIAVRLDADGRVLYTDT